MFSENANPLDLSVHRDFFFLIIEDSYLLSCACTAFSARLSINWSCLP